RWSNDRRPPRLRAQPGRAAAAGHLRGAQVALRRGPAAQRARRRARVARFDAQRRHRARARVRAPVRPLSLMRIAVVAGGRGGLYLSILMRKIRPDWELTLYERNAASDAFGFGVVFSDETLTVFEHADPETYSQIAERFVRWSDIDMHRGGRMTRSGGHGFSAIGRRDLLGILQERALGLGADIRFQTPAPSLAELGW